MPSSPDAAARRELSVEHSLRVRASWAAQTPPLEDILRLIRGFSIFSQLANIADDHVLRRETRALGAADAARGDDSPDEFELPLLDRCAPQLAAALGEARVAALGAAATGVPIEDLLREVVGAGIEE